MAENWTLSGEYFEACNCDVGCPCVFTSNPTHGKCTVLIAWHVKNGKAGGTNFDGLSFALAAYAPGNMMRTKWEVAVYVDERATPAQRSALEPILGGQAGGPFAAFGPLIGKSHGIRFVPFEFRADGKKRSMKMRGVGEMRSEAIPGAGGSDAKIAGAPLLLTPEVTVAKAEKLSLVDHGWTWENAGGNSFYSRFEFKGP